MTIKVLFLRHSIKEGDSLTPEGKKLAFQYGKNLEQKQITTFFYASSKNRTIETAKELAAGFQQDGGKAENIEPISLTELAYDYKEKEPLNSAIFQFSTEFAQAQKALGEAKAFHQYRQGQFPKISPLKETGEKLILCIKKLIDPFLTSNNITRRVIIISHGGTVLDSIFYELTGIELSEVGKKGTLESLEGFKLIISGKLVEVEFRGKKIDVVQKWKNILTKNGKEKVNF